jgi:hypothetical protein
MAGGFQISISTLLTTLHTDIASAWATKRIYDDPPYIEPNKAMLPMAFIDIKSATPSFNDSDTYGDAIRQIAIIYDVEITLVAVKPATGSLLADKITKANQLLSKLYAASTYSSLYYSPGVIDFSPGGVEETEPVYDLSVSFQIGNTANWYT